MLLYIALCFRNFATVIHIIKANVGTGIQAMPYAYLHAGLVLGTVSTVLLGYVVIHCMYMLVVSANQLCDITGHISLDYAGVMEVAIKQKLGENKKSLANLGR